MRIGIDGECGFTFGVDEEWRVATPLDQVSRPGSSPAADSSSREAVAPAAFFMLSATKKAKHFLEATAWHKLLELLVSAGLLQNDAKGEVVIDVERTLAMLVHLHRPRSSTAPRGLPPKCPSLGALVPPGAHLHPRYHEN